MYGRLLLTGILALGIASAQRGGGGGGGMGGDEGGGAGGGGGAGMSGAGGGGMGGGGGMARKPTKAEQFADKLKLNNEQREQVQTFFNAGLEKAGTVRQELDKQRAQIAGALIDGKSGDDLNKALSAYAEVAAQMTRIEVEVFTKTYAILKPNQQSKADQAFELMAGIFNGEGGGRGGRGGGRPGGGMDGGGGGGRNRGGGR